MAETITSLSWVADGIDDSERPGAQALVNLEATFGQDGAPAMLGRAWLEDDLNADEISVLQSLEALARTDETAARQVIAMPFLESIEPDDFDSANLLHTLATQYPDLFRSVLLKPWVEDGLDIHESAVLQSLAMIADTDAEASVRVLNMPYLDSVKEADVATTDSLRGLSSREPGLFQAALTKAWVEDGLDADEAAVLESLTTIAGLDREAAPHILGMPFLESLEEADAGSVETLAGLATRELALFKAVVSNSWVEDGLNGDELRILQMLEPVLDRRRGSEVWIATLAHYDTPTTFSEGGLADRYDANGNNAIEHDELLAAVAEFSADQLNEDELVLVASLYGFSKELVPTPSLRDLAHASPWYRDGIDDDNYRTESRGVSALEEVSNTNPDLATAMLRWAWLFDEPLVIAESSSIEDLASLAQMSSDLGQHLVHSPWVWDGIEIWESSVLSDLRYLGRRGHVDFASEIVTAPWVVDGLTFAEGGLGIDGLSRIATEWDGRRPGIEIARDLLSGFGEMPGAPALYLPRSLSVLPQIDPDTSERLVAEPWFVDGLDNEERVFIVGVLRTEYPDLALSPYSVQHRVIDLPLAGTVNLWAARNGSFDPQLDVLTKMERAVRGVEEFWGIPFHKQDVIAFLSGSSGTNSGRIMRLGTDPWSLRDKAFYRQAAQYYFNQNLFWFNKAGEVLLISYLENGGVVLPMEFPVHCRAEGFNSHQELWDQGFPQHRHVCWTDIGVHLLVTLHDTMGEELWKSALRSFYLKYATEAVKEGVFYADEYDPVSEDVYRAFIDNTPPELVADVNAVFRRLDGGPYIDPE